MNSVSKHTRILIAVIFAIGLMLVTFHRHPHQERDHLSENGQSVHSDTDTEVCLICTILIHLDPASDVTADAHFKAIEAAPSTTLLLLESLPIRLYNGRAPPFFG